MTSSVVSQFEQYPAHGRVLVVDDDKLIRTLVSEFLRREGYEVVTAESCMDALATLEDASNDFQFLVTDWELPDGSGIDLIRHVRHVVCSHYMYIIMATSHGHRDNLTMALNTGADDFLAKPIDRRELVARMRSGQRILELESRLTHLANSDLLTGLPTRRVFEDIVVKEWSRSRRYQRSLACAIFDIDYFKRVNDIHGHAAGDQVLREVGRIFADSVRKSDIICRYGGEEFCALLPETSAEQARAWAENLRKRVSEHEIVLDSAVVNVTISIGIAESLSEMEEPDDLIEIADQCLIEAKTKGRNRVICFSELQKSARQTSFGKKDPIFGDAVAADAMTPIMSTVTSDSNVVDISKFFLNYRIPSAPVVDQSGNLVGVVSDKDLIAVASQPNPHKIPISEVMRKSPICYPPNIPLRIVWEFLNRVSIRALLISENGKTMGILSRQSILRWLANSVWKNNAESRLENECHQFVTERLDKATTLLSEASRRLGSNDGEMSDEEKTAMLIGTVSRIEDLMTDLLESLGTNSGASRAGEVLNSIGTEI
ncbi:diguanylate cyclase [bacterium]|nr:diguanylate cyclase [bacterium]